MPRFELPVTSAQLVNDGRSVVLRTAPRVDGANYAVTLDGQSDRATDILTDLTGVEATLRKPEGRIRWTGWLPHLDLTASQAFTAPSTEHEQLFKMLKQPGTLALSAQLDLSLMLRTATQPESKLDYEYPPETVTVVFKSSGKLDVKSPAKLERSGDREVRVTIQPKQDQWLPLEITMATGSEKPSLDVSWFTAEDSRLRHLPLRRVMLPWAKPMAPVSVNMRITEIEGGDWERGKKIFFGDQAACHKCHQINGEGGTIGANLSNLIYRDYASVMKDITQPSAAINPDHIAYNVELKDGTIENGVVMQNNAEKIVLGQANGQTITIPKTNYVSMKASAVSLMPENLLKGLDAQQQKDLMTFLLTVPKKVEVAR
jgi:putative heme-binding domain-containing protein